MIKMLRQIAVTYSADEQFKLLSCPYAFQFNVQAVLPLYSFLATAMRRARLSSDLFPL